MDSKKIKAELASIRVEAAAGRTAEAFRRLKAITSPDHDYTLQTRYASLLKEMNPATLGLQKIKIALLGTSTLDLFASVFRYWLAEEGFDAEVFIGDFGIIHQAVLDRSSRLYEFEPEIIWLFTSHRDVRLQLDSGSSLSAVEEAVKRAVGEYASLWDAIRENSSAYVLQNNCDIHMSRVFGNFEGSVSWSHTSLLRLFNIELAKTAGPGRVIFDIDYLSSLVGKKYWYDARYWYHSKHAFNINCTGMVAYHGAKLIGAIRGKSKKCIVLDLDNTLWGGVVADDGLEGIRLGDGSEGEAYVAFQQYLKLLKDRGILLAVSSKNDEDSAKEPFLKHPETKLRLDDFVVFRANWKNKADNIRDIAATLNIGLDSLVFVDDNPAERALVRMELPMVVVPEMPEDPADYIPVLANGGYFETVAYSGEDQTRHASYKENASRNAFQANFTNMEEYLENLGMTAVVGVFDELNIPRIAQLINKSNQFHLTTTRYTEADIMRFQNDPQKICRYFKLKDRFGDYGLVSAVILEAGGGGAGLFIDTWAMSCRVLSRGLEEFIMDEILSIAAGIQAGKIYGRYIPTKKNKLVAGLYGHLNFKKHMDYSGCTEWVLELADGKPAYHFHIRHE